MESNCVLIHYHEIGLKNKNRSFFENKLLTNLQKATLKISSINKIEKYHDRLTIQLNKHFPKQAIIERLLKVFGIANFSFSYQVKPEMKKIKKLVVQLIKEAKENGVKSVKIETSRADKKFPKKSPEINQILGQLITQPLKVKLDQPDLTIFLEITPQAAFVYTEKIKGPGGLPTNTAGNLIALLSGGIDSPVAAWQLMKRGAQIIAVHFHSYPRTNQSSIEKVKKIARILSLYQFGFKLYLIPFLPIQEKIFREAPTKYRVLLYRRAMLQIASQVASKEKALGIITGESLGQVASQTLENLLAVQQGINLPLYRPLIGQNKEEIIDLAQKIKTYPISVLPHQDCCSLFLPRHPATKANSQQLLLIEKKLELSNLINQSLEKTKIIML